MPQDALEFLERHRVVTPLGLRSAKVRGRREVLEWKFRELLEEGPAAYKDVAPVVASLERAWTARRAVELRPMLTLKD